MRSNESFLRWKFSQAMPDALNLTSLEITEIKLQPGEHAIAQIGQRSNNRPLLVTDTRIIQCGKTLFSYDDVLYCDWIDRDREIAIKLKGTHFSRLIIELKDGRQLVLEDLGQAVFPLLKLFWFKMGRRGYADTSK
jgi:hypothetical protein